MCLYENTLTQIIASLNFSDRTKFKRKYINPLISEELLAMTVPDKPNSRFQKYYTTEKENHYYYAKTKAIDIQNQRPEMCPVSDCGVVPTPSADKL